MKTTPITRPWDWAATLTVDDLVSILLADMEVWRTGALELDDDSIKAHCYLIT